MPSGLTKMLPAQGSGGQMMAVVVIEDAPVPVPVVVVTILCSQQRRHAATPQSHRLSKTADAEGKIVDVQSNDKSTWVHTDFGAEKFGSS